MGPRPGVFPMRGRRAAKSPQHPIVENSRCFLCFFHLVAASVAMGCMALLILH